MKSFVLTPFIQNFKTLKRANVWGLIFCWDLIFLQKKWWKSHPINAGSALGTHWLWSTGGGGSSHPLLSSGVVAMAMLSIRLDQLYRVTCCVLPKPRLCSFFCCYFYQNSNTDCLHWTCVVIMCERINSLDRKGIAKTKALWQLKRKKHAVCVINLHTPRQSQKLNKNISVFTLTH